MLWGLPPWTWLSYSPVGGDFVASGAFRETIGGIG